MSSNAALLIFAICFIAIQVVLSHPDTRFNPTSIERDIVKNADDAVKEISKEIRNQESKVAKEMEKLRKKYGLNPASSQCLQESRESVMAEMQEIREAITECTNSEKESVREALGASSTLVEMLAIRSEHKENIKKCKNENKDKAKGLRDAFRYSFNQCILG